MKSLIIPSHQYTFGDVYCGAEGMSCGAIQAGLSVKFGIEQDPDAFATFRNRFQVSCKGPMSDEDFLALPPWEQSKYRVDILHLSPPCQPFSTANTTPNPEKDAENRACLTRIKPLLEIIKPRIATIESVPNLEKYKHREDFRDLIGSIESLGYNVDWKTIACVEHGVPQKRNRLFIIAAR